MEEATRVKRKYESELMKKSGVTGCAVGYRTVNGRRSKELCIICYVRKKVPERELGKQDIIPREIEGVLVDVVESGEFKAL